MNNSQQRDTILKVVNSSCDHPNAEVVLERAREIMPSINIATVYRNLAVLESAKKILRISIPNGDRFDKTLTPHAHFRCQKCDKIFDIDLDDLNQCVIDTRRKYSCQIDKVDLVFSGLCVNCKKNLN
ncbi:MAG: transcriptional repressor [Clostridia bacterium]